MLIKCENVTIKNKKYNGQLKIRSEAGFPLKGSRTSPLYSSKLGVEVLICLLVEMSETDK